MFNQKRSNDLLRLCLLALAFIIFTVSSATAQNAKVTERVTDQNGDPVVGAAVMIKGTKKGAGTDINGRYSIAVPVKATLEFSSLACLPASVPINGRSVVDIVLKEDAVQLKEAVIEITSQWMDEYNNNILHEALENCSPKE